MEMKDCWKDVKPTIVWTEDHLASLEYYLLRGV